jgi:hypothetical protein
MGVAWRTCHRLLEKERRAGLRKPVVRGVGRSTWSPLIFGVAGLPVRIGADARLSPEWSEISSNFASQMRLGYTSSLRSTERIKINR